MRERVSAWLSLLRIGNCLIIGFAGFVGYVVSRGTSIVEGVLVYLSAMAIGGWGNVVNDYFDVDLDKINKPWRPIPRGVISRYTALLIGSMLAITGTVIAYLISFYNFVIALLAVILLHLYSWKIKRLGLLGNITIALLSFMNILFGGVAGYDPFRSILPGFYAFLVILGRELYKGLEDVEGDRARGVLTIAVKYGVEKAVYLGTLVLLLLVIISPLPVILFGYGIYYLVVALVGVDVPILYAIKVLRENPVSNAWKTTRILKIPLFAGLVAFLVG